MTLNNLIKQNFMSKFFTFDLIHQNNSVLQRQEGCLSEN